MSRIVSRRSFVKMSAAAGGALAWSALSFERRAHAGGVPSVVGIGAAPYGASLAQRRAAIRFAMDQALPPAIGGLQTATVKVAMNSRGKFPKTASPFAAAEAALWAAEQTTGTVTVGDHSGTYPGAAIVERGGRHKDSLHTMSEAGVVEAVQQRIALAPNIRIEPFDNEVGTGSHLIDPDYDYAYEFQTVLAPGARLWRVDLSEDEIAEFEQATGLVVGPDDGLMNVTTAVSPETYFINVARISHHVIGGITYATKALVGILDHRSRMRMHFILPVRNRLAGMSIDPSSFVELGKLGIIPEIALARQPELNVIDASKIQLNSGPDSGRVHELGFHLFIASTDIVATDAVCLGVHKYAYQRYREAHPRLPLAYRHLDLDHVVWNHGMIRHGGEIGLGATGGCDVSLEDDVDFHGIDGYSSVFDFLVEHVLSTAPPSGSCDGGGGCRGTSG